jgi:hypothetical protein
MIDSLTSEKATDENNRIFILILGQQLVSVVAEDPYYAQPFTNLSEQLSDISNYEMLFSFLVLANFCLLTGLQWLVKL